MLHRLLLPTQSLQQWERAHVDLDAERKKLQDEWREANSIRESLVKEATTMKAMGQLVQAKTLKFDMGSMLKVSGLGGSIDFSSIGGGGGGVTRPGSAAVGAGGGGGGGGAGDGAAQMRLGALVRELQEQVQAQARQLQERQAAQDRMVAQLAQEMELRKQQERTVKVRED